MKIEPRGFGEGSDVTGQRAGAQAGPRSLFFVTGRMTGRQEGWGVLVEKRRPQVPHGAHQMSDVSHTPKQRPATRAHTLFILVCLPF